MSIFYIIANAIGWGFAGHGLWDKEDGFFYDYLHLRDDTTLLLRVRSLVGLMPLLAVETIDADLLVQMPDFRRRIQWLLENRPHLTGNLLCSMDGEQKGLHLIVGIVTPQRLKRVLSYMLDEEEFLSSFGIRSLSKVHSNPYRVKIGGETFDISYQPAESESGLFGGNSNWRGPVWFPINFLIIQSLQRYHAYYGDEMQVEFPTRSGNMVSLGQVAEGLTERRDTFVTGRHNLLSLSWNEYSHRLRNNRSG